MLIRVWGVRFICINIYSNHKYMCVDSFRVIMYRLAHVLYSPVFLFCFVFIPCIYMNLSLYILIYLCFLVYLIHLSKYLMNVYILLLYGYELICVCEPVYLLLCCFTSPIGVIQFIAPELIWISTSLYCSSFHNKLFILYPV